MQKKLISLSHVDGLINGTVQLTGSKSESNRALIIEALSKGKVTVENISNAADTIVLKEALELSDRATSDSRITIDIGPAGTAMRFLTSYLTQMKGSFLLTGTERMKNRPIGILTQALSKIGGVINFQDKEGYPPLLIEGSMAQENDKVSIKGNISSQYITSLLLIAPTLPKGLKIEIIGDLTSRPYVTMTLDMMQEAGINYTWDRGKISIPNQEYKHSKLFIEPDWSAASYWYSIVALSKSGELTLTGLKKESLQGDSHIVEIMKHFGVETTFVDEGIKIKKVALERPSDKSFFDFKECPDLAQTIVVLATALKRDITLTGLETLKIKETDRVAALQTEISKYGGQLIEDNGTYHLKTDNVAFDRTLQFATYEDHRMAMAFSPLALLSNHIKIEDPYVVDKSYPNFWKDLQETGFLIN